MKHLILIRHAKSSWNNTYLTDFERPLAKRGIKDALLMEKFFFNTGFEPDLILCSPANRTQQTYDIIFNNTYRSTTIFENGLYHAGNAELINIIKANSKKINTLAIIGHNPSLHNLLRRLTKKDFRNFATSAIACLQIDLEWEKVEEANTELIFFKKPRDFKP